MKVMMIDDSAADRKLCRVFLEEIHGSQLEFFEAAAAAPGLKKCRDIEPDCILLDYRLPDMTGIEFLSHLRDESGGNAGVAVVMLTGAASDQVAVEAMKAGAQDYLVKDRITPDGLGLAILKATQKAGLVRALEAERDRMARSLAEKEVLLQEIHHRVKNNLQVVASLLRLQADSFGDEQLAAALRQSQHRVESMALIHEQLYESADLRRVDLAKHAQVLLGNLLHAYGADPARISGRVEMGTGTLLLGVDQAIPAGLILNELISNALKHAFPGDRRGSILVEGSLQDGVVALEVSDTGIGLPEDFRPERAKSLGLRIVQILSRQLKGTFEAQKESGSRFRVRFPENTKNKR